MNICGILSKQHELSKFLKPCLGQRKIDVVILAETWPTKLNCAHIKIPGYISFLANTDQIVMVQA